MAKEIPHVAIGEKQVESIGKVAISMLAVGLTAGLTLIAAAKRLGELIAEDKDGK
ncbi:MAG: hypothetical protein IJH91_00975 [Mogibacterium sp.]|nr:hypothetical protein [Mogibacterium sp.]